MYINSQFISIIISQDISGSRVVHYIVQTFNGNITSGDFYELQCNSVILYVYACMLSFMKYKLFTDLYIYK